MFKLTVRISVVENEDLLNGMAFAKGADQALRIKSSGCLPKTRTEIITAIILWATQGEQSDGAPDDSIPVPSGDCRVLWLCGVVGSGKSSIAIATAKILRRAGLPGSLYAFESALRNERHPLNMFSTIARHLAEHDPIRKKRLLDAIRNPDIQKLLDCEMQFNTFILDACQNRSSMHETLIVIDGFDECGDEDTRKEALNILTQRANDLPKGIRILVTSRHEKDIQAALDPLPRGAALMLMAEIPEAQTLRDINLYVQHTLGDVVDLPLTEYGDDVRRLAVAAKGSFQWASTACNFVRATNDKNAAKGPAQRLREVLDSDTSLYALYKLTLDEHFKNSRDEDLGSLMAIFGGLVCAEEPLSLQLINKFIPNPTAPNPNEYKRLVRVLASLLSGTHSLDTPITPVHTSFVDFLQDQVHSGRYWVNQSTFDYCIAKSCVNILGDVLQFNICKFPTSFKRNVDFERIKEPSVGFAYACRFWTRHTSRLTEAQWDDPIINTVSTLLTEQVLEWLEAMSLYQTSPSYALACLAQGKVNIVSSDGLSRGTKRDFQLPTPDLKALVDDVRQFASMFASPITESAPHVYLSALPFVPSCSKLHKLLERFPGTVQLQHGRHSDWPDVMQILEGHTSSINSVAFSPDGSLIASCSGGIGPYPSPMDCTIRVWDAKTGALVGSPFKGHTNFVTSIAFSPNGELIASGSGDNSIRVWEVNRGVTRQLLAGHTGMVTSVAFCPDRTRPLIASGSEDKTIRIWNVKTGAIEKLFKGHERRVTSVAFSPDGNHLASGSGDNTIRLWETSISASIRRFIGHTHPVTSVAFGPDGTYTPMLIASGSEDKTIRLWERDTGAAVAVLNGHATFVTSVAFSADGMHIASASWDKTIRVWTMSADATSSQLLKGHSDHVTSVAFSPNEMLIASGSEDKTVWLWNSSTRTTTEELFESRTGAVTSLRFSSDGAFVASGSDDHIIRMWNASTGASVGQPFRGHTGPVTSVAFSPDNLNIVSCSEDETIRMWDARTCTAIELSNGNASAISAVRFSPDGEVVTSGLRDGTIWTWNEATRTPVGRGLKSYTSRPTSFAFSPDGTVIALALMDKTIRLCSTSTGTDIQKPIQGQISTVTALAISSNNARIVTGSEDQTVRMWDLNTGTVVGPPFKGHTRRVTCVAFSANDMLIASGSDDGTIRIWNASMGAAVGGEFKGHTAHYIDRVYSNNSFPLI